MWEKTDLCLWGYITSMWDESRCTKENKRNNEMLLGVSLELSSAVFASCSLNCVCVCVCVCVCLGVGGVGRGCQSRLSESHRPVRVPATSSTLSWILCEGRRGFVLSTLDAQDEVRTSENKQGAFNLLIAGNRQPLSTWCEQDFRKMELVMVCGSDMDILGSGCWGWSGVREERGLWRKPL